MANRRKDSRLLAARLWAFQAERAPLYGVLTMALITCGVIYNFANSPLRNYLTAVAIVALYLLQIRTADEKKDFEHDNIYHPDRPVQRGVVTLGELAVVNKVSIASQLVLYVSLLDARIMLLGLLSQSYAFLTKKEFFVREWIRQHFFIYYITHYTQLVILFYALAQIIRPNDISPWVFVAFFMSGIVTTELGRKMYPVEEDTTDDTYSAQLGHSGSAIALAVFASMMTSWVFYLIGRGNGAYLWGMFCISVLGMLFFSAFRYAHKPDKPNADRVEKSSNLMYLASMLSVILGA